MINLKRPIVVEPFTNESETDSTLSFSTNLNEVGILVKLSRETKQLRLILPGFTDTIPEDITESVTYYTKVDDNYQKASFGPDQGQVNFPLKEIFYAKFTLELASNSLNVAVLRVHDGDYDYTRTPSDYPNVNIATEEVSFQINHNTSEFLGTEVFAPTNLIADYKMDTIGLSWEDTNDIDTSPLGSGYLVYYTLEQNKRVSTYKRLLGDPLSSYSEVDSVKEVLSLNKVLGDAKEIVEAEGTNTESYYEFDLEPSYKDSYYIKSEQSNLAPTAIFTATILAEKALTSNTAPLERIGAKAKIGVIENTVISFIPNVEIVFENAWGLMGVQTLEVIGDRLKELSENTVKDMAETDLISINLDLSSFRHSFSETTSVSISTDTVDFGALNKLTTNYEVEGLEVLFSTGASTQILRVVSWVKDLSVTFSENFVYSHNLMSPQFKLTEEDECAVYLAYLNKSIHDLLILNQIVPTDLIEDSNLIIFKYKGLSPIYTHREIVDLIAQEIETASIIVDNYPSLAPIYTYDVFEIPSDSKEYYSLQQSIIGIPPNITPVYFFYKKVYLDPTVALANEGVYLTGKAFSETPIYKSVYYRAIETEVETIVSKNDLTRTVKHDVTNLMLKDNDELSNDRLIFFQISFLFKDSTKNLIVEGPVSKEFFATILNVNLEDIRPESPTELDIQKELISEITSLEPDLDLKPGSVTRTVFINPFSAVMENLTFREYFREVSQSFVSLLEFDGITQKGLSIPVNESDNKIKLREAYGLDDNDTNNLIIQEYIDARFDLLASNFGVVRDFSSYAQGEVLLSIASLPIEDESLILPSGSIVSTSAPALDFATLNELRRGDFSTIQGADGKYNARVFIKSLEGGSKYLVPAGSIDTVSSSTVLNLRVTNALPTYGGKDSKTNRELVELVRRKLLSVDTGTSNGYLQKIASIGTIDKVKVVTSGEEFMRRDYDFVLNRKGHNAVDIYIRGLYPSSNIQKMGFFFDDILSLALPFKNSIYKDPFNTSIDYIKLDLKSVYPQELEGFIDIHRVESIKSLSVEALGVLNPYLNLDKLVIRDGFQIFLPIGVDPLNPPDPLNPLLENEGIPLLSSLMITFVPRKDFNIAWDKKPFVSIVGVVDGLKNSLKENLNYSVYNNSYSLLERNSYLEDSGITVFTSPLDNVVSKSYSSAESDIWIELENCWYTCTPYLEFLDDFSHKFYPVKNDSTPFRTFVKDNYFYINIPKPDQTVLATPGSSYIKEYNNYTIYYGRDYSKSKVIQVIYNTDIYIDLAHYGYFPSLSFESPDRDLIQVEHGFYTTILPNEETILEDKLVNDYSIEIKDAETKGSFDFSINLVEGIPTSSIQCSSVTFKGIRLYFEDQSTSLFSTPQELIEEVSYYDRVGNLVTYQIKTWVSVKNPIGSGDRGEIKIVINGTEGPYSIFIDKVSVDAINAYNLYLGDSDKVYIRLLGTNFGNIPSGASLLVFYYNNLPLESAFNKNVPSLNIDNSDHGITLISDVPHTLAKRGIDLLTVIVRPTNDLEILVEPYEYLLDYKLKKDNDKIIVEKLSGGNIIDGQPVDISYDYSNEILVSYHYDLQVNQITDDLKSFAHAGSNFLVKRLNPLKVNVKAIIFIYDKNKQASIDSTIRRDLFLYSNGLDVGESLFESDVIGIIEQVSGVRNVRVKLSALTIDEGEVSYGESISRDQFIKHTSGPVEVYYTPPNFINERGDLISVLNNTPLRNGGFPDKERSVYCNGVYYTLVDSPYAVSTRRGLAHIASTGSVYISLINPEDAESPIEVTYQVSAKPVSDNIKVHPFQYVLINRVEFTFVG